MTIRKAGTVWVNIDEYDGGQHSLQKVQRHGVLARGVLYYCAPENGTPLCVEQSDWHWLLGRGGVNLSHAKAVAPIVGAQGAQELYGVAISGTFTLPHAADGNVFEFWLQTPDEQQSWIEAIQNSLAENLTSTVPRSVMGKMIDEVKGRHHVHVDGGSGPKSTLGLVVTGIRIVSIVPGAPASMPLRDLRSNGMVKIEVGDSLLDVDGTPVTSDNAPQVLRGADIVGSLARVRLEKRGSGGSPAGLIEVKIARSSIARIKPLSEMVLAMAKVADPKHISHVTPAQIHHMKKLADDYIDIETRIIAEYQGRIRDLEELALSEADISGALCKGLQQSDADRRSTEEARLQEARTQTAVLFSERMAGADEEISRLRHQVADAQERLDGGTLELQERDATLLLLREQLEGAQEKVEEFAKEREGHASELAGLRGLVVDAERRCEDADARARALRAELGMVTEKLNGKEDEVSRVNKMLKEIQHALERGAEDIKRKDGELERLQRLQSDTQSRLVESQRAVADRVKTAEDRATAAETAERSLRSRQGTESEERKSVMADMARDLQTLRGELSTKEGDIKVLQEELQNMKSSLETALRDLEKANESSRAKDRAASAAKETVHELEEVLKVVRAEQVASRDLEQQKVEEARQKAAKDSELRWENERQQLKQALEGAVNDIHSANKTCEDKDELTKRLYAEIRDLKDSIASMQESSSAAAEHAREHAHAQRELDAMRKANADMQQLLEQRAADADGAAALAESLKQALESARRGSEDTDQHQQDMVRAMNKLDLEVRDLTAELKAIDDMLQRCVRSELSIDDEHHHLPRADLVKAILTELQARGRAHALLLESQEAAAQIFDDLLDSKKSAHGGGSNIASLGDQAVLVRARVQDRETELGLVREELHKARELLGGHERRKSECVCKLVDIELSEALEKCGRTPATARDKLLEKARRVNSELVADFVKMQRTLGAALISTSQILAAHNTTPSKDEEPPADLLLMLVQVRVLIERLGRIPQLQGDLALINSTATRALSAPFLAGMVANNIALKTPVEKVELLAGVVLDADAARFAWGSDEVKTQRLHEVCGLLKAILAPDGMVEAAARAARAGGQAVSSTAPSQIHSPPPQKGGQAAVGSPYPPRDARLPRRAGSRIGDEAEDFKSGDGKEAVEVAQEVWTVFLTIDEVISDAMGVARGQTTTRCAQKRAASHAKSYAQLADKTYLTDVTGRTVDKATRLATEYQRLRAADGAVGAEGGAQYLKEAVRTGSLFFFSGAFDKPAAPMQEPVIGGHGHGEGLSRKTLGDASQLPRGVSERRNAPDYSPKPTPTEPLIAAYVSRPLPSRKKNGHLWWLGMGAEKEDTAEFVYEERLM